MSVYFAYLYSLIIMIGLGISLVKPEFFWWIAIATLLINFLFIWLANKAKFNINFWNFLISPFIFFLSGLLFLGFSNSWPVKILVTLFLAVANTIFLYTLITFIHHRHNYKNHSLSNISRIINLSGMFFWFVSVFDLKALLQIPIWILTTVSLVITYLIIYQYYSISKIKTQNSSLFIIISTFLILELFYIVDWLPFLSIVKGILVTSAYYFISSLSRHYIESSLAKSVYLRYSLITGLIWLSVLVTARWE